MTQMDNGYRMLAAQCLRKQTKRLAKQIKLVGEADQTEIVHQARVAARRLGAALSAFKPLLPAKKLRAWRPAIRAALGKLGSARDKDVQIGFVRAALERTDDKPLRAGLQRLRIRLEQRRAALEPSTVKAAGKLRKSGVLKAVRRYADRLARNLPSDGATIQTPKVFDAARKRIRRGINRLLGFQDCLADASKIAQHHQMRIVAKRLRYTLEIFQPAFEGELDAHVATVRELQEALGDLHDCDVWLALLPGFLASESKRAAQWYGESSAAATRSINRIRNGIERFQAERQAERERLFAELGERWRRIMAEGRFEAMTGLVERHHARAKAEAEAAEAARKAEEKRLAAQAAMEAELARQQAEAEKAQAAPKPDQPAPEGKPQQAQPAGGNGSEQPAEPKAPNPAMPSIILGQYTPLDHRLPAFSTEARGKT